MKSLTYTKLNAFASDGSLGNPAACIYLNKNQVLTGREMQKIAAEHKGFVSEVVYCTPLSESEFLLKYYSSEREVDFCGHGTIACMYNLMKNRTALSRLSEVGIEISKGKLVVYNEIENLDAVFISSPKPEYLKTNLDEETVAKALDITPEAISDKHPIALINAGLNTLIVPIAELETELSIWPDEQALKRFCISRGIDIVLVYTTEVSNHNHYLRTRVFAPTFGYLEDKATGSGNSALGYYMINLGMWNGQPILIEQNAERTAYNIVRLKTMGERVLFGGGAATRIEGKYFL